MELLRVITIEEVKQLLDRHFGGYELIVETVDTAAAAGRILAEDIVAAEDVPPFRRSTMDGYAVRSADVSGASETLPAFLRITGEVLMGQPAEVGLKSGEAVYVPTGGMIPDGADSVVMIEYCERLTDDEVAVYRPAAARQHVIGIGDDIGSGDTVLESGLKLKPSSLGVLTSLGRTVVKVFRKPAVSILSTGDEIAGPGEEIRFGQIRDINTYTLSAAAENLGCEVINRRVVKDDQQQLSDALRECCESSDIVFLSGGSSAGVKDYSLQVIDGLGEPGVLSHGIAFKPGKPTIIADTGGKPVIGLPGHPVSAMIVFSIIAGHLFNLINKIKPEPEAWVEAELTDNVSGAPGRECWQMVELIQTGAGFKAKPVYGASGLITMLAHACGTIRIPLNTEGFSGGAKVRVYALEK